MSKDADFLDHYLVKGAPPRVLLLSVGNISNRELIALFEAYLPKVLEVFEQGSDLVMFNRKEVIGY